MPAGKGGSDDGKSSSKDPAQRTTFRPPWVKDGPNPLPAPTIAPWQLKNTPRRDSNTTETDAPNPLANVQLRKTSINAGKEPQENGKDKENTFVRPPLKKVPPKEPTTKPPKEKIEVKLNSVHDRKLKPPLNRMPTKNDNDDEEEIDRVVPATRHALVREESMRRLSQTLAPAPPPMPPPAPALPGSVDKKKMNAQQQAKLELLKSRPKVRPDWTAMLKEIEGNKKLKHVECNDRSQPLLPEAKETDHFLYESETPNVHNELLKQIQFGIKLKKVKTNDRSKPVLEGLRKFRRQMTIEEQIQKSVSMASIPPDLLSQEEIADEADEMDDIDKVRDDLQSTKQMLAMELRNKEAQIRENKRLLARIQNLEAELEKEKNRTEKPSSESNNTTGVNDPNEKIIKSLKTEAEEARKTSQELEKKYTDTAEQLDSTKTQLEDIKKQNQALEKKLQDAMQGKPIDRKDSMANGAAEESEEDWEVSESSEDSDGEDNEEKKEKRLQKELKMLRNKLRSFKNKQDNAKKERIALREIIKKHQKAMKDEKSKYKSLKKEVDNISKMMKDVGSDEEDEDEEEEKEDVEEETEEEEEESSEESEESDEDDTDSEVSQSEDEEAPTEKKKLNVDSRAKRHEKILEVIKKGNYLLKTNAERLQDDLNKQKLDTAALQEELDSVLAELG